MAFDRPIEADRVDDLGLFGSLIRAPVVGIMWLLGGEHSHDKTESEEEAKQKQEDERLRRELTMESSDRDENDLAHEMKSSCDRGHDEGSSGSNSCHNLGKRDNDHGDPPGGSSPSSSSASSSQPAHYDDKENEDPSPLHQRPSVGLLDPSDKNASDCRSGSETTGPRSQGQGQSSQREQMDCPATQMIDGLVAAMEGSHITNHASQGPASAAVLSSASNMTSSSTDSLSASYSASTFSNHNNTSQTLSLKSSTSNSTHLPQTASCNSGLRGSKKMSWSDECGGRSLVEYFDDTAVPARSKHWSAMRRNSWRATRHSFDGAEIKGAGTRRGEVKVIKSALKRSGSYSPPVSIFASSAGGMAGSTSSSAESSSTSSSSPGLRSFRSLSVIGSSDSSRSNSSDPLAKESIHSHCTEDSMAAVTNKKLNSTDVQYVPSSLKVGCGRTSGGLIIPRGGPSDPRYYFPRGGNDDPRYHLTLGAGVPGHSIGQQPGANNEHGDQNEKSVNDAVNEKSPSTSSHPTTSLTAGRNSPGHHHHFLPRHTNGYISPQYGFYVNITPPTPELYATRNPHKSGDKPPKPGAIQQQQQSYQQFQYQSKYQAPSTIPEGSPDGTPQNIPQRFVGRSSVPRPSSKRATEERDQLMSSSRQTSLKPTFTKNKKGMGMLLAENPHHGVWPTVPFG
eukprot:CAMPEP_0183706006 /NCGR_PEP_ID=MMETSP0737-20130205/2933_1 /TAXON_ID=385413 /ORGANISM="Thalassiosira miniscula, Strain CCMP1093" /LENGTH=677 /DNA_ID=CAMNT_0025933287 /DNA_START=56 /DNA_END=2089 /DNA_ORIENTATION=+